MSRGTFWKAAALGVALATPAAAGTTPIAAQVSPLALPIVESSADAGPMVAGAPGTDPSYAQASSWESIRYRPRRHHRDPDEYDRGGRSRSTGFYQLHGGFIDPDGAHTSNALGGFRAGANMDQVQLGVGADWSHRSDETSEVVTEVPIPGGGTAERRRQLASSSSDLVPMMAVLQFTPGYGNGARPYIGIGGGYEVLFLSARDFTTGDEFKATYGGWGWQAWGGLAIPLGGRTKLNAEIFRNSAEVGRDVNDVTGTFREVVNVDGTGGRFGFSWGF